MTYIITLKEHKQAIKERKERIQHLKNLNHYKLAEVFEKELCKYYNTVRVIDIETDIHFISHKKERNKFILENINIGTIINGYKITGKTNNSLLLESLDKKSNHELLLHDFNLIF